RDTLDIANSVDRHAWPMNTNMNARALNIALVRRRCLRVRPSLGFSLVWAIVCMTALMAFASLAVDLGRVQAARSDLQRAADAVARYAVAGVTDGTSSSRAYAAASDNSIEGTTLALQASDVVVGTWSGSS